jgi:hypothetical protein
MRVLDQMTPCQFADNGVPKGEILRRTILGIRAGMARKVSRTGQSAGQANLREMRR